MEQNTKKSIGWEGDSPEESHREDKNDEPKKFMDSLLCTAQWLDAMQLPDIFGGHVVRREIWNLECEKLMQCDCIIGMRLGI